MLNTLYSKILLTFKFTSRIWYDIFLVKIYKHYCPDKKVNPKWTLTSMIPVNVYSYTILN